MAAQAKHHDYHLVDPSPWPIVGADLGLRHGGRRHHLDAPHVRRRPDHLRRRHRRRALHHGELVGRRHQGSPVQGRPHPRGADQPPLRHDPVHRLRGDVLRRLVLGLLQFRAVPGRRRPRHPRRDLRLRPRHRSGRLHRARHLAAEGHRDLRSLASAAAQHAAAADVGHHGDLGAPCAARGRPQGPEDTA